MVSDVFHELESALEVAAATRRGQLALRGHDEDFQIEVDGQPFHLAIERGGFVLSPGASPRRQPMRFTRVQVDAPTLHAILAGDVSPVEAMEQGKLFLRTRLYGGALFTMLLRAAYDLARESRLAARG